MLLVRVIASAHIHSQIDMFSHTLTLLLAHMLHATVFLSTVFVKTAVDQQRLHYDLQQDKSMEE